MASREVFVEVRISVNASVAFSVMYIEARQELNGISEVLAEVSENESRRMQKQITKLTRRATRVRNHLNDLIDEVSRHPDAGSETIEAHKEVRSHINDTWRSERKRLEEFLARRRQLDDAFAVTLFGRTSAGKSTLLEGIIGGDGSTIGQGEQRTTQKVTAYDWKGLRLIDTPGISAFDGDADEVAAWEAIDRCDLILFMVMSDSVQKSEFDQFVDLRDRNKPVLVVLNVKRDVDHPVRRRRFLRKKKGEVTPEGQAGNIEELKSRARRYLGHPNVPIVPIHARCVYLARHVESDDESAQLLEASRLDHLLTRVQEIAVDHGESYRIQTYRDQLIHGLRRLIGQVDEHLGRLGERIDYHEKKQEALETWFDDFEERSIEQIRSRVSNLFESKLYGEVDHFVEKYAGDKSADARWRWKMRKLNLKESLRQIAEDISDEAESKIEEHVRQEDFDASALSFDIDTRVHDANREYWGAAMDAVAALMDIIALFTGGLLKFVGSAIRGLKSLIGIDDRGDYRKKKAEAKRRIKKKIRVKEKKAISDLTKWFDGNIADPFKTKAKGISRSVLRAQKRAMNVIDIYRDELDRQVREEHRDLVQTLVKVCNPEEQNGGAVEDVVRKQGTAVKVRVSGPDALDTVRRISETLGEPVDPVESSADTETQIHQALASVAPAHVSSSGESRAWTVIFPLPWERSISREGIETHVRLTEQLLDISLSTSIQPADSVNAHPVESEVRKSMPS